MNPSLIIMPNKLSVVGVAGEQAANDASPFAARNVEERAQMAMSRAAALVANMPAKKVVQLVSHEPVNPVPTTSRSAALVTGMDAKAKEYSSTPPSQSEHLIAFESVNRLIATAHDEFASKWAPVAEFTNSHESYSDDDLRDAIAHTGDPAEFEAESQHIKQLASESKSHLAALSDHVAVYSKVNGSDSSVQEVSERVQASLADLAPASTKPSADDENENDDNEINPSTGYGTGHADSGSITEAAKRALRELQKLIEAFLLMLKRLLGLGAKPA